MAFFLFSAIALTIVIYGLAWLVSNEHEYRTLGFPWYKRPIAFWVFVITGIIAGLMV